MGLSESKVILATFQSACRTAETNGKSDVISLLEDSKFINDLRKLWAHIPLKTRRSIGQRASKGPRNSRRRPKTPNKSPITLSHALKRNIHLWESNTSLFFIDSGISLHLETDPLAEFYTYTTKLEGKAHADTIRLRFCKVAYHRLKERLCLNYLRSDDMEMVSQVISESDLTKDNIKSIKRRVSRWIDEGKRLDALCRDINGAASMDNAHLSTLFCLPVDIPDTFIKTLPLTGPSRKEEIRLLKDRGISRVEGRKRLEKLANDIYDYLWEPMESAISHLHKSNPGSSWSLQHTQYFRLHDTVMSFSESDEVGNNSTSSLSDTISQSSGSAPPVSEDTFRDSEPTIENGGATNQGPTTPSLPMHADQVQRSACSQDLELMDEANDASSRFESNEHLVHIQQTSYPIREPNSTFDLLNVQPLQTVHAQPTPCTIPRASSTFNLLNNVQPLQAAYAQQTSYSIPEVDSTFNSNQPLQTAHAQQSPYPIPRSDSTFNLLDNVQPLQATYARQSPYPIPRSDSTFNLLDNVQPLQATYAQQSPYPVPRSDSTFNLFDNVQPLQTAHAQQTSYPIPEADSTFNSNQVLQTAHAQQSPYPISRSDSTFSNFEVVRQPHAPHRLQDSFSLYKNIQPPQQSFSSFRDDYLIPESSRLNRPQSSFYQRAPTSISVP